MITYSFHLNLTESLHSCLVLVADMGVSQLIRVPQNHPISIVYSKATITLGVPVMAWETTRSTFWKLSRYPLLFFYPTTSGEGGAYTKPAIELLFPRSFLRRLGMAAVSAKWLMVDGWGCWLLVVEFNSPVASGVETCTQVTKEQVDTCEWLGQMQGKPKKSETARHLSLLKPSITTINPELAVYMNTTLPVSIRIQQITKGHQALMFPSNEMDICKSAVS